MWDEKKKVLILGGGFGGIKTALELAGHQAFEVALMSDRQDFRYYPQLYHAATGGNPLAASIPLSEILKNRHVGLIHDSAIYLDRQAKTIHGHSGHVYHFDILI